MHFCPKLKDFFIIHLFHLVIYQLENGLGIVYGLMQGYCIVMELGPLLIL